MIDELGHVRVITNDNPGNAPGDYALVRVKVGLCDGYATPGRQAGWELIGFGYTTKTRSHGDYVDIVYRFGGAS